MRDLSFYRMKLVPASLLDYLRRSSPERRTAANVAKRHREVCDAIKQNPALIGLDALVELFEERPFVNQHNLTVACPDFITFSENEYTVVEIATQVRTEQLKRAFKTLLVNFGVRPKLIAVNYTEQKFDYYIRKGPNISDTALQQSSRPARASPRPLWGGPAEYL